MQKAREPEGGSSLQCDPHEAAWADPTQIRKLRYYTESFSQDGTALRRRQTQHMHRPEY